MTPEFDWNQFQEETPSSSKKNDNFNWEDFEQEQEEPKSFFEELPRHASRIGSRIAETIGGIPGDVSKLIESGVFAGLEKVVGFPVTKEMKEEAKEKRLPTSGELKEFSKEKTKGLTEPRNDTENSIDEYVEMVSSLLGPMKFRKILGISLGSQAAKEGLKYFGASEGSQEAGKLGTMFLLSALNPKGAMDYASKQYNISDKLSKGASITAKNFENELLKLEVNLQKGVTTPAKNVILKPIAELLDKIKNGKIPIQDLTAAKRDLNTLMVDPVLLKREKKLLKKLAGDIDNAIKPYEKINPEFSKSYRPANEIYGAISQGNKAYNLISKAISPKSTLGAVIGEAALGHPEYIPATLATAGGLISTAKGVDFLTRLAKSPELQKYYTKAMTAAVANDMGALRKYSDKIDEIFNSQDKVLE